ncbi:hypothetical protein [Sediminicoccus sp. BL-A-41-H5]|jgi:hypothetical protein
MTPEDKPRTITTDEARQGQTVRMTRYVLGFGLVLVVIAFVAAWVFTPG